MKPLCICVFLSSVCTICVCTFPCLKTVTSTYHCMNYSTWKICLTLYTDMNSSYWILSRCFEPFTADVSHIFTLFQAFSKLIFQIETLFKLMQGCIHLSNPINIFGNILLVCRITIIIKSIRKPFIPTHFPTLLPPSYILIETPLIRALVCMGWNVDSKWKTQLTEWGGAQKIPKTLSSTRPPFRKSTCEKTCAGRYSGSLWRQSNKNLLLHGHLNDRNTNQLLH